MKSETKILAQSKDCPLASPCNSPIIFPQPQSNENGNTINAGVVNIGINNGCIPPCKEDNPTPVYCSCSEVYDEAQKKCVPKCDSSKNQLFDSSLGKCICYMDATMKEDGNCVCEEGFYMDHESKTCVNRCPKVEEIWNNEKEKCVSICADDQIYNTGTAKCECSNGKIWNSLEGKCNCPLGKKPNEEGLCVTECPADKQFEATPDGEGKCVDRCALPSLWDLETKTCICPEGMIFSIGDNNCICSERMKLVNNKCEEACEKGQIYNRKDDTCEEKCKEEDGVGYCIVTDVCKCLDDTMVYNENKKMCEKPADPKKCEDEERQVYNNETQQCECDKSKNYSYSQDLGCTCLQPYKENSDGTACVFDPNCKEDEAWSTVNNQCEKKCQPNERWNSETSACEIPKCKDSNQIYDEEKKQCVDRCPEGKKWCNVCKQCTDACNKDSGFTWDPVKKDCVKNCQPPQTNYNPSTKKCECPPGQVFNEGENKCENKCAEAQSIDFCATIGTCKVCNPFKKLTALPTTQMKNDVTYNLGYSPECSNRGYLISGICYCTNGKKGDKCELEAELGIVNGNTMANNLNLLFSIWPGYYPNQDDPLFPRNQSSIGSGSAWRGPTGNSWLQLHSLVNKKFTIFEDDCRVNTLDITQGSYGNCYMVAALAAMASLRSCLIKDSFLTHEDNPDHIYVTRWFMHGRPRIVSVDDWVPAQNGKPTGVPPNGRDTFWVQILEKSWSKILGSYQNSSGGNHCDVLTGLTGAPNEMYYHQSERDLNVIRETVCGMLRIGRPVGTVAHSGKLDNGHAYAIVGCFTVNLNGKTYDLIQHYNPYNQGSIWKTNPWGDGSQNLEAVKDQIPGYIDNDKDGYVYQSVADFKNNFSFVIASWSMPGYSPLIFETPWNTDVRFGNWFTYTWTLTVKPAQVGKKLFIYIHNGTPRNFDDAAWECNGLTVKDKNGLETKSFKVNSGRYPIDKYNQIIVDSPIEGEYTISAGVRQKLEFGSFPLAVYAVTNGVQFSQPFKKYDQYDSRYHKPCTETCTSGICNFSRGRCA